MKKILYVHGYNGNPYGNGYTRLKNNLPKEYELYSCEYDQTDCVKAVEQVLECVEKNKIDLIIGSSLGGFITLLCTGHCRFVNNICLHPSIELPKIGCTDEKMLASYKMFEEYLDDICDNEERVLCEGFFADNDELLGDRYHEEFSYLMKYSHITHGGHKMTDDAAKKILNEEFLNNYWNRIKDYNTWIDAKDNAPWYE